MQGINLINVCSEYRDNSMKNSCILKPAESARIMTTTIDQTEEDRKQKNLKKYHSSQPSTPRRGGIARYPGL